MGNPRQASLYHYFKTKDDILCDLLSQTVAPTLSFIPNLLGAQPALSAAEHLHVLRRPSTATNCSAGVGSWRALPAAPTSHARLEPFWSDRERLRLHYLALSRAVVDQSGVHEAAADLPFRLVESLVNMWSVPRGPERSELPFHVADACLRVLGIPDDATPAVRERSRDEVERYARAAADGDEAEADSAYRRYDGQSP